MKVFFYPHKSSRDRQLDTIRYWSQNEVLNPRLAEWQKGKQVSSSYANSKKLNLSWKSKLPLLNIKLRPKNIPKDAVVYVWGGLIATGKFIIELDNPWVMTGYNFRAFPLYRIFIKWILISERCIEIRCLSEACRESLRLLLGEKVYQKSKVYYPLIPQVVAKPTPIEKECRFLFIGTQFEIKGGAALLKAFKNVYEKFGKGHLSIITHLPPQYNDLVKDCSGITVYEAKFSRQEIFDKFMKNSDVLILPTYMESFGMVTLEALSHGLAIIATDMYAMKEMVIDGKNGFLLNPPISVWDGFLPSKYYYDSENYKYYIEKTDTSRFILDLEKSIETFIMNQTYLESAKNFSVTIFEQKFKR